MIQPSPTFDTFGRPTKSRSQEQDAMAHHGLVWCSDPIENCGLVIVSDVYCVLMLNFGLEGASRVRTGGCDFHYPIPVRVSQLLKVVALFTINFVPSGVTNVC